MITRRDLLLGLAASGCAGATRRTEISKAIPGRRIVVVGAGVAGLAAAKRLRESSAAVTVVEALDRVGGRVYSVQTPAWDSPQELGAQYFNDHYMTLLPLFETGRVALLNGLTATSVSGNLVTVDAQRPGTYVSRGVVSSMDGIGMAVAFADVASSVRALPLDDFGPWDREDGEGAVSWLRRNYGLRGADYVGVPAIESLFFGSAAETSAATFKWMIANADRAKHWYTSPDSNYAACTNAMKRLASSGVTFVLGDPVVTVEHDADGRARATLQSGETLVADGAIVTCTGVSAHTMVKGPSRAQAQTLAAQYAATVVVNVVAARPDPNLRRNGRVYGVNIPRIENPNGLIASFSVESGKTDRAHGGRELYGFHLHDAAARSLMDRTDDTIVQEVLREAERFVGGLRADFVDAVVQRWPSAIPMMSIGHAGRCRDLWIDQAGSESRVLIAGDHTSVATMDGAAWSGRRAAQILEAKLSVTSR